MSRQVLRLLACVVILAVAWWVGPSKQRTPTSASQLAVAVSADARQTWGRPETLNDHFARHGRDFQANSPEDYAAKATAFLQRAKTDGLPAKRDRDGSLRVYDPSTDTFAAYNSDGTTKTFFKPGSPTYFERQPGTPIDLRHAR
jgi:pyocin large subunit-like protein